MVSNKRIVDVSIVSANFNKGEYIHEYFESILNSSVLPNEIILIDDASTDNSLDELRKFKHLDFLTIKTLTRNAGFAEALNIGIRIARSRYIMRLDPDDFITENRIKKQFTYLNEHPDIDILGSNAYYFNQRRKRKIYVTKFPIIHDDIKTSFLKGDNGILHSSVMGKVSVFRSNLYNQENYPAEDYDIFARMIKNNIKFENLPEPLTYYRIYKGNTSFSRLRMTVRKAFVVRERIFHKPISSLKVWLNYQHLYWYRLFLLKGRGFYRYFCLVLSLIFRPGKIIKRIKS